jgi:hypothetical protein
MPKIRSDSLKTSRFQPDARALAEARSLKEYRKGKRQPNAAAASATAKKSVAIGTQQCNCRNSN